MTPLGVVRLRGGHATTAEILGECSRQELAESVRAGTLLRARRGVYVLPALLDPLRVAARVGGVASHQALALEAGLVAVEPQVLIVLPRRKVRVDLADRSHRLVIEADSYTYHGTRAAFREDCDRYNDLVGAGWTVLRFTWEHVMFRPDAVRRAIRETVAQVDACHAS